MSGHSCFDAPDAIIIGSGAGGGTAAHVLTGRGWKVVVLEKGEEMRPDEFLPFDELHFRDHKTLIPRVDEDPMVYVDAKGNRSNSERWWGRSRSWGARR